jgi:hypothetical protein
MQLDKDTSISPYAFEEIAWKAIQLPYIYQEYKADERLVIKRVCCY